MMIVTNKHTLILNKNLKWKNMLSKGKTNKSKD
jgi:hypothetical protein